MQIILMEKIGNLGQLGDIVKVKDGYARNYLIPHGKAKRATEANIADFEKRRAELEKNQSDVLARAQAAAAGLEGLMLQITQKAGVDGKLFGSVTNVDVAEMLENRPDRHVGTLGDPHHRGRFAGLLDHRLGGLDDLAAGGSGPPIAPVRPNHVVCWHGVAARHYGCFAHIHFPEPV